MYGLVVVALCAGIVAGVLYYLQRQQDLKNGHWRQISLVAGQPAPTAPTGSFLFAGVNGDTVYTPPADAPVAVSWTTQHNSQRGYSIAIPTNWTQVNPSVSPQALQVVCPPGTDLQAETPGVPPCVSYGWLANYQPPAMSDASVADVRTLTVSGISGYQFTQAALGANVTAYFPYHGGTFVLTADADSDAAMYAFQHMLASLTFAH